MNHHCKRHEGSAKVYEVIAGGVGGYDDHYYVGTRKATKEKAESVTVPMDQSVTVRCIHIGEDDPDKSSHRIGLYNPLQGQWSEYSELGGKNDDS